MNVLRRKWQGLPRGIVVVMTALAIYVPLLFIVVQSSAPFCPHEIVQPRSLRFHL